MKVFVTSSTGNVGSLVVKELLARGAEVRVLARKQPAEGKLCFRHSNNPPRASLAETDAIKLSADFLQLLILRPVKRPLISMRMQLLTAR